MFVTRGAFVELVAAWDASYLAACGCTRWLGRRCPPVPNQRGVTRVWQALMDASTSIWSPMSTMQVEG